MGKIYIHSKKVNIPVESFISAGVEKSHLEHYLAVKEKAHEELEKLKLFMQKHDPEKAKIFKAHMDIVDDVIINEEIPARILNEHWSGDWAIYQVYETVLVVLRKTSNPLLVERSADFDDVRSLLLRLWYDQKNEGFSALTDTVIIAAYELMPSDTACIDKNKVLAILTETGGVTSHTAIIAKSYGIPTILSVDGLLDSVKNGQLAAVNVDEGLVVLDPEESIANEYIKKSGVFHRNRIETESCLYREGRTADGVKIEIGLNIESEDIDLTAAKYADSVGLFRTEFLYMGRKDLPTEDEQFAVYRKVLECFGEKPVVLRTLDIGADKQLSSLPFPREENPSLGNRALRFCFSHPEIFKTQIRAALRASIFGNLWIMFPMVGSLDDIRMAKKHIVAAEDELKKEGKTCREVKIGIMIEIPSIALTAGLAAREVDFASIGSNDLCQYLCAADRTNSAVESYYQGYHPAVWKLIKEAVTAFINAGKSISICGELGSDLYAMPVLAGLGLRKFSMGPASVAAVKSVISSLTIAKAQEIAGKVMQFSTADEVKLFLKGKDY